MCIWGQLLTCLSLMTWSNLLKANGLNFISSPSKSKLLWRISFGLSSSLVMWSTRCYKTKQKTYRHLIPCLMKQIILFSVIAGFITKGFSLLFNNMYIKITTYNGYLFHLCQSQIVISEFIRRFFKYP